MVLRGKQCYEDVSVLKLSYYVKTCMFLYVCVYAYIPLECSSLWRSEESAGFPVAGTIGVCELPDLGNRN